jgi:hypothetical protein
VSEKLTRKASVCQYRARTSLPELDMSASREDPFVCGCCLERFKDPRALPCGHTFCFICIEKHRRVMQDASPYRSFFTCPACRCEISLYHHELPKNWPVVHMMELQHQQEKEMQKPQQTQQQDPRNFAGASPMLSTMEYERKALGEPARKTLRERTLQHSRERSAFFLARDILERDPFFFGEEEEEKEKEEEGVGVVSSCAAGSSSSRPTPARKAKHCKNQYTSGVDQSKQKYASGQMKSKSWLKDERERTPRRPWSCMDASSADGAEDDRWRGRGVQKVDTRHQRQLALIEEEQLMIALAMSVEEFTHNTPPKKDEDTVEIEDSQESQLEQEKKK